MYRRAPRASSERRRDAAEALCAERRLERLEHVQPSDDEDVDAARTRARRLGGLDNRPRVEVGDIRRDDEAVRNGRGLASGAQRLAGAILQG